MIRNPGLVFRLSALVGLSVLNMSACGQKGPPLAPIVYLPRPVSEVVAKRIENDIVLQFTVPDANTDGSAPADLRKIEVYAHTGPLPAPADFLKYGTLVASVDIKQPPTPDEQNAEEAPATVNPADIPSIPAAPIETSGAISASGSSGDTEPANADPAGSSATAAPAEDSPAQPAANTKPVMAPSPDASGTLAANEGAQATLLEQGATTAVRETLTPKHMEIGPMPPTRPAPPSAEKPVVVERLETAGTVNFVLTPQRYYTVVGVSESRNRRGPFAGPFPVALIEPTTPPEKVDLAYTADAVSLSWPSQPEDVALPASVAAADGAAEAVAPAGPAKPATQPLDRETEGTYEFFSDVETEGTQDVLAVSRPATGSKPKPTLAPPPLKPRFGYNVYELPAEPDASGGAKPATAVPDAPLNTTLLTTPAFVDARVEFGVQRCYVVRRVEMAGTVAVESAPSSPTCVTPVDTFPPAPPKSLAHIAGGNGVSLLWEANTEPDLGGYLVLRGEAPDEKLSPLTPTPITDTSFTDTTTRRGRTYFYEVVAVDRSTPPNQSAPSERVEETIR